MSNNMETLFTENEDGSTTLEARIDYIEFNGFVPKLMSFFFKGMFKKGTQKWFDQFKDFAEKTGE